MGIFFNRVTIIGVGLIGGSLAKFLREKNLAGEIYGVGRTEENLQKAKRLGLIDQYFLRASEDLKDSDLIILSSPVGTFLQIAKEIGPYLRERAIVTDVGSVKGDLVGKIEEALSERVNFVGSHPIAGKESSGVESSSGDLFKGAKCILTLTPKTDKWSLDIVKSLWEEAGCEVILMDPYLHDRVFAAVSHLPHVIAYALVNTVARMDFEGADSLSLSGKSFKDLTRIALSPPELWRDICLYNKDNLLNAIDSFEKVLKIIKEYIEKGDGAGLFKEFVEAKKVKENS
jgi:prephenate dehydrogenase